MSDTISPFSDDEVIASVKAGHIQNFDLIIRRYSKKIILFIQRMIGDADEAENIAQEAFLKVYENLSYYREENNFSAFLFKISRNLTLNYIKKQKRIVFFSQLAGRQLEAETFSSSIGPAHAASDKIKRHLFEQALREISEDQRLALVLKVFNEMSYKEIAGITGWSIPKIETLISRAKSAIRKKIEMQEKGKSFV